MMAFCAHLVNNSTSPALEGSLTLAGLSVSCKNLGAAHCGQVSWLCSAYAALGMWSQA